MQKTRLYPIAILIVILSIGTLWHYDIFHKPVEPVSDLIGKDYTFAIKYFHSKPSAKTSFSITDELNEFQGGVLSAKATLKDSIIEQYTWEYNRYKITIWTARTKNSENEIIDAIRYKNSVEF